MAYANSQATAENQGVSMSSSAQGGGGSIVSQMNDNLSFLDQYGTLSDMASRALGKANDARTAASTASSVANLSMSVFSNSAQIQNAFKPKKGP